MQVKDFTYELPQELVAQYPLEPRDHSRLLVVDKNTGTIEHRYFYDLCEYLRHDDLLVFNDTRVIPARLHGVKDTGARVEVFLLTRLNSTDWEVLVKPGRKLRVGAKIKFSDDLSCDIIADTDFGGRIARFYYNGVFEEIWIVWVKRRCLRILRHHWKIRNVIKQSIQERMAVLQHQLPDCILPKNFCKRLGILAAKRFL